MLHGSVPMVTFDQRSVLRARYDCEREAAIRDFPARASCRSLNSLSYAYSEVVSMIKSAFGKNSSATFRARIMGCQVSTNTNPTYIPSGPLSPGTDNSLAIFPINS